MSEETILGVTEEIAVTPTEKEIVYAVSENQSVTVVDAPESEIFAISESNESLVTETIVEVVVVVAGEQGPPGKPAEEDMPYAKRTDFVTDSLIYRGEAEVGTADATEGWRIRRITIGVDGDVTEEWAGGSSGFTNAWNNRASLSYY